MINDKRITNGVMAISGLMVMSLLAKFCVRTKEDAIKLIRALKEVYVDVRYHTKAKRLYPYPRRLGNLSIRGKRLWEHITKTLEVKSKRDWLILKRNYRF